MGRITRFLDARRRYLRRNLLAATILGACGGGEPERRTPATEPPAVPAETGVVTLPVDPTGARDVPNAPSDTPAGETDGPRDAREPPASVVARFRQQVPASAFVRHGACPFECCIYRAWTALQPIVVRAQPRDSALAAFTLKAGEPFRADSGNVYVTSAMIVAVNTAVGDANYWSFSPGDSLVVLDYVGEGHYNVWHDGKVQEVEGFWDPGRRPVVADRIGTWKTEWWVHVTNKDGRAGWFHVNRSRMFTDADACG